LNTAVDTANEADVDLREGRPQLEQVPSRIAEVVHLADRLRRR